MCSLNLLILLILLQSFAFDRVDGVTAESSDLLLIQKNYPWSKAGGNLMFDRIR